MKAIVQDRYGPADVLELREVEMPTPGDGEAVVQVRAAGVDRGVWHLMTGLPYFLRLIIPDLKMKAPKNPIRGSDVAGVVHSLGPGVSGFAIGDEVFGIGQGSYAEFTRVPVDKLAPKPTNMTFEQAAAVPISGLTALQALRDGGDVHAGDKVLVIGASGGVGTFAVQIARSLGAEVTGVCSSTKVDLVRSLGAHHVIDYTREDFADQGHHYDVIVDTGGHSSLTHLRRALTSGGRLVIVGAETDGKWFGGFDRSIRAMIWSLFLRQKLVAFVSSENATDLVALTKMIEANELTAVVDRTFSLNETAKAITYLQEGHARGKVAITV